MSAISLAVDYERRGDPDHSRRDDRLNDVQRGVSALAARRFMMINRRNRHPKYVRRATAGLAVACILWLSASPAHAQTVEGGEVSGTLVSASALGGETVLTVPSDKEFVLTPVVQRGHSLVRAQGRQPPRRSVEHQRRQLRYVPAGHRDRRRDRDHLHGDGSLLLRQALPGDRRADVAQVACAAISLARDAR